VRQDVDAILADTADLAAHHGLDPATARLAVQAMLDDQPLPLVGETVLGSGRDFSFAFASGMTSLSPGWIMSG
jgi:hypothetical protein